MSSTTHVPVAVVAHMAMYLSIKDPLHSDGLLLAARERRDGVENRYAPFEALAKRGGLYCASAGFLVCEGIGGPLEGTVTRVRRMDMKGRDGRNVHFPPDSKQGERVVDAMSPMRNTLVTEKVLGNVRKVVWQALGDPDEIRDLVSCVPGIGKMYSTGYGEVEEWEVVTLDDVDPDTCGLVSGGRVLRNMPAAMAKLLGAKDPILFHGRVGPPYALKTDHELIAAPILSQLVVDEATAREIVGYA